MTGYNFYQPTYQPAQNGLNWVQGMAGAKAWMIMPGQTALLMDSEGQTFYIKSADQSGMPTLRVFDFVERAPQQTNTQQPDVLADLIRRIEALEAAQMPQKEVLSNG